MFSQTQGGKSDQKQFSGQKNYPVRNDSIIPMTLRMIKTIKVEGDNTTYKGTVVSYLHVVARVDGFTNKDSKKIITINDDTSFYSIVLSGTRDTQLLSCIQDHDISTTYYKFVLHCKPYKEQIFINLQNVELIKDSNAITHHFSRVILCEAKRNTQPKQNNNQNILNTTNTNNQFIQMDTIDEEPQLEQQIYSFIFTLKSKGCDEIAQQAIINEFINKNNELPKIKKALQSLMSSGQITQGNATGTFIPI